MTTEIIDVADLDCIFLTYDEPKKEEFWIKLQNMVPWAKRVDGIKGSDAAHKQAARVSDTDRFILIDGDNIPDPVFFNLQLTLSEANRDNVFRWKARNHINGLMYGNGGVSCWTKDFVNHMKTHENTDGRDETVVEFCFDPKYIPMHDCYSTTYPNSTPFQAWRAGFREGVKMSLDRGVKTANKEFKKEIHWKNLDRLRVWLNVGADVENGLWAILGARHGCYMTNCTDWDYVQVRDFDYLTQLWKDEVEGITDLDSKISYYGTELKNALNLEIAEPRADASKFFKAVHIQQYRAGAGFLDKE